MYRLILPQSVRIHVEDRFNERAHVEDGVFVLAHPGTTDSGLRLVGFEVLDPPACAWDQQGPDTLAPSAQWLSAAISRACAEDACLVLVHSHPHPLHPAALSALDISTMRELAPVIEQITGAPFVLIAVKQGRWAGALSINGLPVDLDRIDAVGHGLSPLSPPAVRPDALLDDRQIRALGGTNAALRSLTVAVIGCGGTGAAVAEQVHRMGVARLILVDHDTVDTESNVRRMLGSTMQDADQYPHPHKVDVVARRLRETGLPDTEVVTVVGDVRNEGVFRTILDADVAICTTDTHSSRAVLNDAAYAYALPLIDLGARVSTRSGALEGLVAERRIVTLERPCLWCTESISRSQVAAENMEPERRAGLQAEGYVAGGGVAHEASIIGLNVLAAALGACALPGLLTDAADRIPHRTVCDGMLGDSRPLGAYSNGSCSCHRLRLLADAAPIPLHEGGER